MTSSRAGYLKQWKAANLERVRGYQQKHREKNREQHNLAAKNYYTKNKERILEAARKRRAADPDKRLEFNRRMHYRRRYGNAIDYSTMLTQQSGACFLCGVLPGIKRLHVDHCHESGKVRSLLCTGCNIGLGNFKDNPDLLRKAAAYIEAHK